MGLGSSRFGKMGATQALPFSNYAARLHRPSRPSVRLALSRRLWKRADQCTRCFRVLLLQHSRRRLCRLAHRPASPSNTLPPSSQRRGIGHSSVSRDFERASRVQWLETRRVDKPERWPREAWLALVDPIPGTLSPTELARGLAREVPSCQTPEKMCVRRQSLSSGALTKHSYMPSSLSPC